MRGTKAEKYRLLSMKRRGELSKEGRRRLREIEDREAALRRRAYAEATRRLNDAR